MLRTVAPEAWSGLADLRPMLESFLTRRSRDTHQVEDAVQETLLRAARYRGGLSDPARLRPWLLRIALNVLSDGSRRQRQASGAGEEGLSDLPSPDLAPEEQCDVAELWIDGRAVALPAALAALAKVLPEAPAADRAVLSAYYGAGLSCRSTARRCRVEPDLVKVRLFRARLRLRAALLEAMGADGSRRAS